MLDVGRDGRELRYTVPDYFNGRLRIVAIGASPRRMGVSEAATEVKGDFILTPNVPAMAAPGDEFLVSVGVFNNTHRGSGSDSCRSAARRRVCRSSGPASVDLQIAEKKEGVGEFRFKANAVLGSALADVRRAPRHRRRRASKRASACGRPSPIRTQLTLGRWTARARRAPLTRDLYSERRTVEAAVSPCRWCGARAHGVSRELRVLLHRAARQQGHGRR